jgi:hypothetical protein
LILGVNGIGDFAAAGNVVVNEAALAFVCGYSFSTGEEEVLVIWVSYDS